MDHPWACQANHSIPKPLLIIGFTEKILYTVPIHFRNIRIRSKREHYGHAITQSDLRQQK